MSSMWSMICALNKLKSVDIGFFIACAVIIVLIVAVYFLIPVFNKKFYQEQRDNLHKREAAFKSNLQNTQSADTIKEVDADTEKELGAETENSEVSKDE